MYTFKKILLYLRNAYAPDLRALSLMRIGLALIILADLIIRAGDLTAHYTDEGIWPTRLIATFNSKPGSWSLHALSGSYGWVVLLFTLHILASVGLLLGYKTKLTNLIVWLLYISLHNRNTYILQSGDDLLRLLLLWGLFMPWGAYYSIDSLRSKTIPKKHSLAALGYLLLLSSVYFFTVNLKTGSEWHGEGSAIYYALSLDQLRLPLFGDLLYKMPALMKILTWLVYYLELSIPVLILWPSKKGGPRLLAFLLVILLHTGIAVTLYVGLFFAINMVAALGLLPAHTMNKLEQKMTFLTRYKFNRAKYKSKLRPLSNALCAILIVLCLIINFGSLSWFAYEMRSELTYPVNAIHLNQYWGMFSPTVMKTDGWFVYYGIDSIGRQRDLRLDNDYVNFEKPAHVVSMYKTDRWRKLAECMQGDNCTFLRPRYCKYILHKWNLEHPQKKMLTLNLYFMEKESLPDYKTSPLTKKLFCVCNDI